MLPISKISIVALIILLSFTNHTVWAKNEIETKPETQTPVSEWMDAENKLIDTLPRQDKRSFFVLRNKHSIIRSIRLVRRDIKNAVKACGKENKDMKKEMNTRFEQWESAVLPVIKLADKFLNEEIKSQKIVHESDLRYVLKLNDKAYTYGEKKIEKRPVTDKKSCENLLKSMDRTEDKMVSLLQDMLLPESVIRERAERAKAAEEKAKAKQAAKDKAAKDKDKAKK